MSMTGVSLIGRLGHENGKKALVQPLGLVESVYYVSIRSKIPPAAC